MVGRAGTDEAPQEKVIGYRVQVIPASDGTTSAIRACVRAYLVAFCLLAATACSGKSPTAPGPLSERLTLARGETVLAPGAGFRLHFVDVTGDSRCPADALCVWGGDAVVHMRALDVSGGETSYELHTGDSARAAVVHGDVRIELTGLQPYPFSSRTIEPGEYRATLALTRP